MTSEEFSTLCLLHSTQLICLHELNGNYIYLSPSVEKILGYKPEQLMGENPYHFFHHEDKEFIESKGHKPSLEGERTSKIEYRFKTKDNGYVWLETETIPLKNNDGDLEHLLTISQNISGIKQKLDRLKQEEILWDEAGRLASLGAWDLDLETMTPMWSKTTYDIHEVAYDEQPALEEAINFYAEEARPTVMKMVQEAIDLGKSWDKQLPFITAKGRKTWVRTIGRPEIKMGKTVKLYGVFQDVSQEIETRNEQKKLIEQLTNQKKQLQDFSQIVSHNLRSPVASLSTLLAFLEIEEDEKEQKEIIKKLKLVNTSLNTLLGDLVDAVKIISNTSIEYETISVEETINKTTALLKGTIEELNATINIDNTAWDTISYPKLYFESILLNLMSNALKYHSQKRKPVITIQTHLDRLNKVLTITDNGLGIDLERYGEKVFKLHKTFHRERPGKGLGLFMVKNQVEATGGKIAIESEPDKGTTFTITFY